MITLKNLIAPIQLGTSAAALYTATNTKTIVDKFSATNTGATAVTFTIYLVPPGGSPVNANKVIASRSIAINETYTCPEVVGHVLENGMTIQGECSAATSVSVRASGREVTQ